MASGSRYSTNLSVSWDMLHRDGKALARLLLDKGPFDGVIAITRGGLVPAAIISRELDIRLVETLCIISYAWQNQGDASTVLKGVEGDGSGWLVLDDLVDTGRTLELARTLLPKAHFAALYAKPAGRPLLDTVVGEVSQETWILFPWDSEVQYVHPLVASGPAV